MIPVSQADAQPSSSPAGKKRPMNAGRPASSERKGVSSTTHVSTVADPWASGEQRVDRRVAAAGDVFGVLSPVAGIEGLETRGSRVFPGLEGGDQGLELDDAFAR